MGLELEDLGNFYGTTKYYNIMNTNATDGIKYIMENGYSWFVTDFLVVANIDKKLKDEPFLSVQLKVKDSKAEMIVTDGNQKILYTQKYDYTDAKRNLLLFFTDNVLMLSGEY